MSRLEINYVVSDCLAATEEYQYVLEAKIIEKTHLKKGLNESIIEIGGALFHLMDENEAYQLIAQKEENHSSSWINLRRENISQIWERAIQKGWCEVMALEDIQEVGLRQGIVRDSFGYVWILQETLEETKILS